MKILIAEDDQISRKLLQTTLAHFGHEVDARADGQEAWAAFEARRPQAVVSDWLMPQLDGLEFCRRIRRSKRLDYTYFILLTANVQGKETYFQASEAGVDDFLEKPLDRDQIWMRLRVAERILRYATQIRRLESMLPICSYCKMVRDDNNYWQQVETYMAEHMGTIFSHSVCPTCYDHVVRPQLEQMERDTEEPS